LFFLYLDNYLPVDGRCRSIYKAQTEGAEFARGACKEDWERNHFQETML
jgi:hypothetical protein